MSRTGEKVDLLQLSLYVLLSELGPNLRGFPKPRPTSKWPVNGRTKGIREDLSLGYETLVVCRIERVTLLVIVVR
jgi:hypothetical protein